MATNEQDKKIIARSLRLASLGAFGLIVPFVGWFLGGYALNLLKLVDENESNQRIVASARRTAWAAIIVSCISAGFWIYFNNSDV